MIHHGSICVPLDNGIRVMLNAYSDKDFDDLAKILYPAWKKDKNITDAQVISYFKIRGIVLHQGACYEYVIPTIKDLCQRIEEKKPLLVESEEIREKERLLLGKKRKQKFFTMLSVSFVFYFISCCMSSFDDKEGAVFRALIWFFWSVIEVIILSAWDVKSTYSKRKRIYSVLSFLSVPIVAMLFVLFFRAYGDRDFLHLTMILFAPAGYFITWIIFLIHECSETYIDNENRQDNQQNSQQSN